MANGSVNGKNGVWMSFVSLRKLIMFDEVEYRNEVFTELSSADAGTSLLEQLLTPTALSWEPDWK